MKKKILIIGVLAVLTLVAVSLVSAINMDTARHVDRGDSPLFGIRTRRAIGDRLQDLRESIKTSFIGERVFFLPFQRLRNKDNPFFRYRLGQKTEEPYYCTEGDECTYVNTCPHTCLYTDCSQTGDCDTCQATCMTQCDQTWICDTCDK